MGVVDWEKEGKRALVTVRNVYKDTRKIRTTASFTAELFLYGQKSVCVNGWFAVSVQWPSCVQLVVTPWTAAHQASLPLTISQSLPKFLFIALVMPSSHLILWCPLLLPSIFPSIWDFSNELSICIRWPKYWNFSFRISPSSEYSELIPLKDWHVWSLRCPMSFQESSPAPQFEGIDSLALCLLYGPAVTTGRDHWEDHSLDYADICQQSNVSGFSIHCLGLSSLSCQETIIFWFHGYSHHLQWFWSPRRRNLSLLPPFPFYLPWNNGAGCPDLSFLILSLKPALSLSSFSLIKRLFSSSSLLAIRVVSSAYLRLLMIPPPILTLACNSSGPAFPRMCSVYRLNKQGDSRQPCFTPFLILNQSIVPYRVLTVASWPTNKFLRRQVRWSGIPISLRAFHSSSWL